MLNQDENNYGESKKYQKLLQAVKERGNRREIMDLFDHTTNKWQFMGRHPGVFSAALDFSLVYPRIKLPNGSLTQTFNVTNNTSVQGTYGINTDLLTRPYELAFRVSSISLSGISIGNINLGVVGVTTNPTSWNTLTPGGLGNHVFIGPAITAPNVYNNPKSPVSGSVATLNANNTTSTTVYRIKEDSNGVISYAISDTTGYYSTNPIPWTVVSGHGFTGSARYMAVFFTTSDSSFVNGTFTITMVG